MIITPGQLNRRAELYHQLGSMLSAGVPLLKALEMAGANPAARGSHKVFLDIISRLRSGLTFAESMQATEGWMPEFDLALLSVGEKSGRLDASFKLLSAYYASRAKIIRDTIAGLFTTLGTLHVFLLIFPLGYLIGFATGIFNNNPAQIVPFLIQKAIVFGLGYGLVFFFIYASQGQRGKRWRSITEGFWKMIPILRTARQYMVLGRLSAALEALVNAGVSIVEAWELASRASGSVDLQQTIERWRPQLDSGATPGELVNRAAFFPEIFANLYNTGEQSGQLDDALARLRSYFEDEGFRRLRLFTRVLNGTIYGLVVLLVAYNVIQFYVGYFNSAINFI